MLRSETAINYPAIKISLHFSDDSCNQQRTKMMVMLLSNRIKATRYNAMRCDAKKQLKVASKDTASDDDRAEQSSGSGTFDVAKRTNLNQSAVDNAVAVLS